MSNKPKPVVGPKPHKVPCELGLIHKCLNNLLFNLIIYVYYKFYKCLHYHNNNMSILQKCQIPPEVGGSSQGAKSRTSTPLPTTS